MLTVLLLSGLLITPDFREPDPMLEAFSLAQPAPPEPEPEPEPQMPSLPWRVLGWLNYGAAGCVMGSQYYREAQSFQYDANPDNDAARISLIVGGTIGANEASDKLYEINKEWGWVSRVASIGVMTYTCSSNFYEGWKNQ